MAIFGYPVAQENDAERAARAALSIQRALARSTVGTLALVSQRSTHASASKPARWCSMRRVRFTAMPPILRRAYRR